MRPVNRGAWPQDDQNVDIVYSEYKNARRELIKRIGEYCSYCETRLTSGLHIEHVKPKKPLGAVQVNQIRALSWDNFLLACSSCNSTKGDEDVVIANYLWPDVDNTFSAFVYSEGGLISARQTSVMVKAHNMIKLVGLDKKLDKDDASDRRWLKRKEAWEIAQESKENLAANNTNFLRNQIVYTAIGIGFWSVWMTVFADDENMLRRFISIYAGTSTECFDDHCVCVLRPGGQC